MHPQPSGRRPPLNRPSCTAWAPHSRPCDRGSRRQRDARVQGTCGHIAQALSGVGAGIAGIPVHPRKLQRLDQLQLTLEQDRLPIPTGLASTVSHLGRRVASTERKVVAGPQPQLCLELTPTAHIRYMLAPDFLREGKARLELCLDALQPLLEAAAGHAPARRMGSRQPRRGCRDTTQLGRFVTLCGGRQRPKRRQHGLRLRVPHSRRRPLRRNKRTSDEMNRNRSRRVAGA
eukprot:scaffold25467_cov112-Isochrysis_galbana.AAC.1